MNDIIDVSRSEGNSCFIKVLKTKSGGDPSSPRAIPGRATLVNSLRLLFPFLTSLKCKELQGTPFASDYWRSLPEALGKARNLATARGGRLPHVPQADSHVPPRHIENTEVMHCLAPLRCPWWAPQRMPTETKAGDFELELAPWTLRSRLGR